MKNFRQDDFNKCLALQPWEKLGMTEDVDVMADMFLDMTKKAFDLCAPEKKIKVHKHHVRGLSDDAIAMMKLRKKLEEINQMKNTKEFEINVIEL